MINTSIKNINVMEIGLTMLHIPVMKNEVINYLNLKASGRYVDMTLGFGGHATEILKRLNQEGHLYGVDQDNDAINYCLNDRFLANASNFTALQMNFVNFQDWAQRRRLKNFDGFLFDLGVSSYQIDTKNRGFSYIENCPLDMRMNQQNGPTAQDLLDHLSFKKLVKIFQMYGQIHHPHSVVKAIVNNRGKIRSTHEFLKLINKFTPAIIRYRKNTNRHIEKKYFLALRIYLNDELNQLKKAIYHAAKMLNKGGRLVIITYHSLERKCVKQSLSSLTRNSEPIELPLGVSEPDFFWLTKKAITPSEDEIHVNKRSHSAQLLCLERRK